MNQHRKAALKRWAYWRADRFSRHDPGDLIGPAEADTRHGYVRIKARGIGYLLMPAWVWAQKARRAA